MVKYANGSKQVFENLPDIPFSQTKINDSNTKTNDNNKQTQTLQLKTDNSEKNKKKSSNSSIKTGDKTVTYTHTTDHPSDTLRTAWKAEGGSLSMRSFNIGATYMSYYSFTNSSYGHSAVYTDGWGFNLNYNSNHFKLMLPDYESGKKTWSCLTWGLNASFSRMWIDTYSDYHYYNSQNHTSYYYSNDTSSVLNNSNIALNFGFVVGAGKFRTPSEWKGVIISFNYKPSLQIYEDTALFSYTGFSIDFNFARLNSALDKIAPKAGSRISFFLIPPINDMPFFINCLSALIKYFTIELLIFQGFMKVYQIIIQNVHESLLVSTLFKTFT